MLLAGIIGIGIAGIASAIALAMGVDWSWRIRKTNKRRVRHHVRIRSI